MMASNTKEQHLASESIDLSFFLPDFSSTKHYLDLHMMASKTKEQDLASG